MREISLAHLLHFDKVQETLSRKKVSPPPDSYFFERDGGKLMYVIPAGQVPAGELEERIASKLQNLIGQVQEQLSKTNEA